MRQSNREAAVVFFVSKRGGFYFLPGDCKKVAIKRFLKLYADGAREDKLLLESTSHSGLLIANEQKPGGWFCYPYNASLNEIMEMFSSKKVA